MVQQVDKVQQEKLMSAADEVFDVIIVGSGAGGMAAALVCRSAGLDVCVLEKTAYFGGSTAVSGGAMWLPGNEHAKRLGLEDTRDAVLAYLQAIIGNRMQPDLVNAYLDNAPHMVAFMEQKTDVRFVARKYSPDYQPDIDGAALGGRTLDPAPFDARLLGSDFNKLRPPFQSFMAFQGMMVNRTDIDHLLASFKSFVSFRHSLALLAQYGVARLKYKRGTRLLMGNALSARLLKSAIDAGISLRLGTAVEDIIFAEKSVQGVKVRSSGETHRVMARRAVVLATGGFPHDESQAKKLIPLPLMHYSMAPEGNSGDGIRMGLAVGGSLSENNKNAAFYAPVSIMKNSDGTTTRFPHLIMDRQKPGLVAVNQAGKRFVNEASSYHEFVEAMYESNENSPAIPAFLICDHLFLKRFGLGLVRPGPRSLHPFIESGYLVKDKSIAGLAAKLGLPPEALQTTIAKMNDYAQTGHDLEFFKGSNEYNRYLGEPLHRPNPCLGPIKQPPFYAVRVYPGNIGTATGLKVDHQARVIDCKGTSIPGLYAVGNDMNSVMAGTYPAAGITLGPALTFGYIAGQSIIQTR